MKYILATFLTIFLLLPVSAFGEIQTITHSVKQPFAGSQSPDDARISAVAKAQREALEMAGIYIESLTVVKNSEVDKDEILALAAGVLKAEVVSQENYHTKDAFGIDVVVKVIVDTSVLEERVKKLLQDRTHLDQLSQARAREKGLLEKIAMLEEEYRQTGKSDERQATLKKEFRDAFQGLTALDWVYRAAALRPGGKYTDPKLVVEYLNNAIKLKPDYEEAYNNRGNAYVALGQHQRAIEDYDEAIRLKPDFAGAYVNRGLVYVKLSQHQRAIEDYSEAIRLKPDFGPAYLQRGITYGRNFKQYQPAIADFDKVIRLRPNDPYAYNNRGLAYLLQGKKNLGCRDAQKACEMGDCMTLKWAKGKGYCR